jgi:hypothetical protein
VRSQMSVNMASRLPSLQVVFSMRLGTLVSVSRLFDLRLYPRPFLKLAAREILFLGPGSVREACFK